MISLRFRRWCLPVRIRSPAPIDRIALSIGVDLARRRTFRGALLAFGQLRFKEPLFFFYFGVTLRYLPSKRLNENLFEGLCRYVTKSAMALERLSQNSTGQVVYELRAPYRDGTTSVVFEALDFLAKLAALAPRPRANLVRYHGIWHDWGRRMRRTAIK